MFLKCINGRCKLIILYHYIVFFLHYFITCEDLDEEPTLDEELTPEVFLEKIILKGIQEGIQEGLERIQEEFRERILKEGLLKE
jgi:hypothetical protein